MATEVELAPTAEGGVVENASQLVRLVNVFAFRELERLNAAVVRTGVATCVGFASQFRRRVTVS